MIVGPPGWWIKPALIVGAIGVLVAAYGGQAYRIHQLKGEVRQVVGERDLAATRARTLAEGLEVSEGRPRNEALDAINARKEADEATQRARQTAAAAGAAGDAHAAAMERLRARLAAAVGPDRGAGAAAEGTTGSCQAADETARVLAELLGRCSARVRVVARFADDSHDAATAGWEAWPVVPEVAQ